jgi:hypothetical protein
MGDLSPLSGAGPHAEHTRILASFHSDEGFDGVIGEGTRTFGFVTGASTSKAFGDAAGTWTLTIKVPGDAPPILSQYADPEDVWVRVQARINGRVYDLMIGLVDTIVEDTTRNADGSQSRIYNVSGSDFGKCFDKLELFVNFWPSGGPPIPQFVSYSAIAADLALPLGAPHEVVRGLIQMWLGNNGTSEKQWMLPSSLRGGPTGARYIYDWLNLGNISQGLRGNLANDPTLLSPDPLMGRSLWDVLQEYSHSLLNEMWIDLGIDPDLDNGADRLDALRPTIYLRERPFPTIKSTRRWDSLHTIELGPGDVKRRRVVSGDGGASRFNWWELIPNGISANPTETQALMQQGDGLPGGMPIYNLDSMRKHGVRRYAQQSKYLALPAGERGDPSFIQYAIRWIRLVHDWYAVAPFQYTGSITTTRMRPDARIGMRLRETRKDGSVWLYYIEGVDQHYEYPRDGETQFTVTRGQLESDNFLDRVYAYYRGVDLSTLSDTEVSESVPGTETPDATTTADTAPEPGGDPDVAIPPEDALTAPEAGPAGADTGARETIVLDEITITARDGVHALDSASGEADPSMVSPPEDVEDTDVTIDEIRGPSQDEIEVDTLLIDPRDRRTSPDRSRTGDNPDVDPSSMVGSGGEPPSIPSTRGGTRIA